MTKAEETFLMRVARLEERSASAYSYDAYGGAGWRGCIRYLIRAGYTDAQIEDILRSKITRWAGDQSDKHYGFYTGQDLKRHIESQTAYNTHEGMARFLEWRGRSLIEPRLSMKEGE